jgi:hypothetical protein
MVYGYGNVGPTPFSDIIMYPIHQMQKTYPHTDLGTSSDKLPEEQRWQVMELLDEISDVPTDQPGRTLLTHDIQVTSNEPVRVKQYPLPYHMLDQRCPWC